MDQITISIYEFMKKFPNSESVRLYLEQKRWNGKPVCADCGCTDKQYKQKRRNKE